MSEIETYTYTPEIQKRIFAMLLFDTDAFMSNMEIVRPEFFDNPALRDFTKIVLDHKNKKGKDGFGYGKAPAKEEFKEEVLILIAGNKRLPEKEYIDVMLEVFEVGKKGDFDYVRDKVTDFVRYQGVKKAILDGGKIKLKKRDYEGIMKDVYKASTIGVPEKDLGRSLYGDEKMLEKRLDDRETKYDRKIRAIKTSFPILDSRMGGGICQPEIGILLAALKQGKTTVAANFARGAITAGKDVVFLSFESSEHSTIDTFDAMMTSIPRNKLMDKRDEVGRIYKRFFDRPGIGQLQLCHMPAHHVTAHMIDSYLFRLENKKGIKPKLLFVDYLSLMRPADKQIKYDGSSSGRYVLLGDIVLELINLAHRRDMAIWILHQAQRGVEKKYAIKGRVGTDDSADSAEICRHADIVLTLNQNNNERDATPQRLVIYAAACRNIEDKWEVSFNYHRNLAQIEEI